jgi:hypothetical protein
MTRMVKDRDRQLPFERRFGIEVDQGQARSRFTNRVELLVFARLNKTEQSKLLFLYRYRTGTHIPSGSHQYALEGVLLTDVIVGVAESMELVEIKKDFLGYLHLVELAYEALPERQEMIDKAVRTALADAEADLGVSWHSGVFAPHETPILDKPLREELLSSMLAGSQYDNVRAAYKHGLSILTQAGQDENQLKDSVVNMYESLEAMAKLVTGHDKDLSQNRQRLVKKLMLPGSYSDILEHVVAFGNAFRHADSLEPGSRRGKRPLLSRQLAESYSYFIGVFLRLAAER